MRLLLAAWGSVVVIESVSALSQPPARTTFGRDDKVEPRSAPTTIRAQPEVLRHLANESIERGDAELNTQNDPRAALKSIQHALDLARQLDDRTLIARSLWNLAAVYVRLEEFDKGLRVAEEAHSIARLAGDRREEAWSLVQVGDVHFSIGRHLQALENFEAALPLMKQVGERFGEATVLKDIGITYRFFGRFDETLAYLHEALNMFRQLNAPIPIVSTLENLGQAYANVGSYGLALDAYNQALEFGRARQDALAIEGALTRMGFMYLDLNDGRLALDHFNRAFAIAEGHKAWLLDGIGAAQIMLGERDAALETVRHLMRLHVKLKDERGLAADLWSLGDLYREIDSTAAIRFYERAIALFQKNALPVTPGLLQALGRAYERQGDLDRAIDCYEKEIARLESARVRLASDEHKAAVFAKQQPVYHDLIETLLTRQSNVPEAQDARRAFGILERAKARAMVEAMADARLDAARTLEPDLRQRGQDLENRLSILQRCLLGSEMTKEERGRLTTELSHTEQQFDRLVVEIKRRSPRYGARRYPEPLTLERTQALLDDATALVAYLVTEDRIIAFLITGRTLHVERLAASPKVLAARVDTYLDLIARTDGTGWQDIGRRLYTDLVTPLARSLPRGVKRLIIIPDGVLHYLPFETLIQDGRFLLEEFTISYAPSATVLAELKAARTAAAATERADLLAVADPMVSPDFAAKTVGNRTAERTRALYDDEGLQVTPIPFSGLEARAVAGYARRGSVVFTGADASERRIKTVALDRFRVIHFATHGLVSERAPARSALVFASDSGETEDGFLQAREISQLKLNCELVVLSACQTARGRVLAGEGVQGLAQAFFYAGAQAAVVSLWNVNDEKTADLMAAFYRHLAEGQTKAGALRAAKLDMLRSRATAAPRYWAPFVVIGDADQPVLISGLPWWLGRSARTLGGAGLSLAGLAMLILLIRRTRGFRLRRRTDQNSRRSDS